MRIRQMHIAKRIMRKPIRDVLRVVLILGVLLFAGYVGYSICKCDGDRERRIFDEHRSLFEEYVSVYQTSNIDKEEKRVRLNDVFKRLREHKVKHIKADYDCIYFTFETFVTDSSVEIGYYLFPGHHPSAILEKKSSHLVRYFEVFDGRWFICRFG